MTVAYGRSEVAVRRVEVDGDVAGVSLGSAPSRCPRCRACLVLLPSLPLRGCPPPAACVLPVSRGLLPL